MKLSGADDLNDELTAFIKAVPPAMSPMAPSGPIGALLVLFCLPVSSSDLHGLAKCGRMELCVKSVLFNIKSNLVIVLMSSSMVCVIDTIP